MPTSLMMSYLLKRPGKVWAQNPNVADRTGEAEKSQWALLGLNLLTGLLMLMYDISAVPKDANTPFPWRE